jgi:hypothetical protein
MITLTVITLNGAHCSSFQVHGQSKSLNVVTLSQRGTDKINWIITISKSPNRNKYLHKCTVVGNPGGGGPWVFLANSFEGGTWGCEKISGGSFLLHFYVENFQNLYRGYMRCPPSPPPVCIYGTLLRTIWDSIKQGQFDHINWTITF